MKFTDEQLQALIQEGKSQKEAAQILGVSEGAVSKRLKRLHIAVNRQVALFSAPAVLQRQLSVAEQLDALGRQARELLELVHLVLHGDVYNDPKASDARRKLTRLAGKQNDLLTFLVKLQGELRKQLEFYFGMQKEIYSLKQVEDFQRVVLDEIQQCAPEVGQRIVARLTEIQATRSSLDFGIGGGGQTL